jgi:L-glyceraldehyde 3-phosphate reductase
MAIAWLLKDARVTSVLIGVSSVDQLDDNLKALNNLNFSGGELKKIDYILNEK